MRASSGTGDCAGATHWFDWLVVEISGRFSCKEAISGIELTDFNRNDYGAGCEPAPLLLLVHCPYRFRDYGPA